MKTDINLQEITTPNGTALFDVELLVDYDATYEKARYGAWEDSYPAYSELSINSISVEGASVPGVTGTFLYDEVGHLYDTKDVAKWALEQSKAWIEELCWEDFLAED